MAFFSFLFYTVVEKQTLTVPKTFASLALFSLLQGPLLKLPEEVFRFLHGKQNLPLAFFHHSHRLFLGYVSYKRINAFMCEDEVPAWASTIMSTGSRAGFLSSAGFEHATFQWNSPYENEINANRFLLGPLSINIPPGELTLITGTNGSGKTALLSALLGGLHFFRFFLL